MKADRINQVVAFLFGATLLLAVAVSVFKNCGSDYDEWRKSRGIVTDEEKRKAREEREDFNRKFNETKKSIEDQRELDNKLNELTTEFTRRLPPVKLMEPAYFKAKGALIGQVFVKGKRTPARGFGFLNEERIAKTTDELTMIIRIDCKKSGLIGQYTVFRKIPDWNQNMATGRKVPVYAVKCEVSVVDYTIPAVIARKTFVNNLAAYEEDFSNFYEKEYVCDSPNEEIKDFIASLSPN